MAVLGIWMPVEIIQSDELTPQEKFIYCEILQLSTTKDGCYAGNNHFAELLNISRNAASKAISRLAKKEYIEVTLTDRNHTRLLAPKKNLPAPKKHSTAPKWRESKDNKQVINNKRRYYI